MGNIEKATNNGSLNPINECYVDIPGAGKIVMNNLPDISDSKSAVYNNEQIMGRSFPLYTYSHSADRNISITIHLFVVDESDIEQNLQYLRWLQSAVYPREGESIGAPFIPPPICKIKCGELLAKESICCALQSYSVKFPTELAWSTKGSKFTPFRFDVDTQWLTVYTSANLPFQNRIISSGR